ncbi:hypothetical protein VNO78_08236 [Psophocarpus tetragonolobus]|uniref:Uncharacterized protein n=1 Tax=Psophocarpus tetragonolobus TaxID=3891 RepID=A0AAN9SW36_PSOTE
MLCQGHRTRLPIEGCRPRHYRRGRKISLKGGAAALGRMRGIEAMPMMGKSKKKGLEGLQLRLGIEILSSLRKSSLQLGQKRLEEGPRRGNRESAITLVAKVLARLAGGVTTAVATDIRHVKGKGREERKDNVRAKWKREL